MPAVDTTPAGLLRLYYRIVLAVVAMVLTLQLLTNLLLGEQIAMTPQRMALYGAILLFSWFGHELVKDREDEMKEPKGILLTILGLFLIVLCVETGGLASAYYMLIVATCLFGALTMRPHKAFLIASLLAGFYCTATWLYPKEGGLLDSSIQTFLSLLTSGRHLGTDEMSALVVHCGFLYVGTWIASRLAAGFRAQVKNLESDATRDPLTGLPNRRAFLEKMKAEAARARQWDWPISVLVMDLDHFKRVNDKYGHPVGDEVLADAAQLVREAAGPLDHVARIGGEEFAVAAIGADRQAGADLADRIVRTFRNHDWTAIKPDLRVTISVGIAVVHLSQSGATSSDLTPWIDEADQALLIVKQAGRNGFLVAGEAAPPPSAATLASIGERR